MSVLTTLFASGESFELAAIHPETKATRASWFGLGDRAKIKRWFNAGNEEHNLYVCLNPVDPDRIQARSPTARASEAEVTKVRWLLIDCDPIGMGSPAAAAAMAESIRLWLEERGATVMEVFSGRGTQLWLEHEEAAPSPELKDARWRLLKGLAKRFGSEWAKVDSTADFVRLARLPGSCHKGTGAVASVMRERSDVDPWAIYDLVEVADELCPPEPEPVARKPPPPRPAGSDLTARDWDELQARSALPYLYQSDYAEWLLVGMALHALGDWGLQLWDEWSQDDQTLNAKGLTRYQGLADLERRWATFKPGTTAGALFSRASKRGWVWADEIKKLQTSGEVPSRSAPARVSLPDRSGGPATSSQEELESDSSSEQAPTLQQRGASLPDYPLEVWPERWQNYAATAAHVSMTDPAMAAQGMSAILGSCLGPSWRFYVRGLECRPIIWAVVVGDSSVTNKSLAVAPFAGALKRIQHAGYLAYQARLEQYRALHKAEQDEISEPTWRPIVTTDTTVEGVSKAFAVDESHGLAVMPDEVSGWLGGMDAYKAAGRGADRSKWLTIWGGDGLTDMRAKGEIRSCPHTHVCIMGGIQPAKLAGHDLRQQDGLFPRIQWCFPKKRTKFGLGTRFPYDETLSLDLTAAMALGSPRVDVSPEAVALVEAYVVQQQRSANEAVYEHGTPLTGQVEQRAIDYLARSLALLAGAESVARGAPGVGAFDVTVDVELVERAIRLAEYYRISGLFAVGALAVEVGEDEQTLIGGDRELEGKLRLLGGKISDQGATSKELAEALGWKLGTKRLGYALARLARSGVSCVSRRAGVAKGVARWEVGRK